MSFPERSSIELKLIADSYAMRCRGFPAGLARAGSPSWPSLQSMTPVCQRSVLEFLETEPESARPRRSDLVASTHPSEASRGAMDGLFESLAPTPSRPQAWA
jgi:hypothetical protein